MAQKELNQNQSGGNPDHAPEYSRVDNPLARFIEASISENGPMPFDQYMNIWNNGVTLEDGTTYPGFYNSEQTTIGTHGDLYGEGQYDFGTFPEMTPIYGHLMAKQITQMWELMDKDPSFQIVEMGGGNGTLAHDILLGLRHFAPDLNPKYKIVEQSPVLVQKQRQKVGEMGVEVIEGSALDSLPTDVKGVFISNELLDDLPAKMLHRIEDGWAEIYVMNRDQDNFVFTLGPATPEAAEYASRYLTNVKVGERYPVSLAGKAWQDAMAASLKNGFIITVDYYNMEGVRKYAPIHSKGRVVLAPNSDEADLLFKENVGKANITSTPDFITFARTGEEKGLKVVGDVAASGFTLGMEMEDLLREGEHMKSEEKIARFGQRYQEVNPIYSRFYLTTSSQRILIQSKGVDMDGKELSGSRFRFHHSLRDGDKFYSDRFVPVKPDLEDN